MADQKTTAIGWRPIDGAPKDDVLILTNGGALWQGFWQEGFGWITGYDDGKIHIRITLEPTHWAPMVDGPKP